jgi:hypothetical protein
MPKSRKSETIPQTGQVPKASPWKAAGLLLLANAIIYALVFWIRKGSLPFGTVEYKVAFSWLWTAVFVSLGLLYVLIYRSIGKVPTAFIPVAYLLFSLILLLTPVLLSSDIYTYAMRGRIVSVHHQNPYIVPASEFPQDKFLELTDPAWRGQRDNYGPLWTLFAALLTWIGGDRLSWTIFLFKLWGLAGNTLSLWLIYRIARAMDLKKSREILALYALNPFILIEFVNNGHNDVWMVVFGLLALYCYYVKKDVGIIPCLILAGLVKFAFWLLIPLLLIFLWREKRLRYNKILQSGALSAIFLVSGYLPFWHGWATFSGILDPHQSGIQRSFNQYSPIILMLFVVAIARRWPVESLKSGLVVGRVLFLAVYVKTLVSAKSVEPAIVIVLTAFAFLATGSILPWYILWWLPILILKNHRPLVTFWSIVGLGSYIFIYSTTLSLAAVGGLVLIILGTKTQTHWIQ